MAFSASDVGSRVDLLETCVKCKRALPEEAFSKSVLKHRLVITCRECKRENDRQKSGFYSKRSCPRCGVTVGGGRKVFCSPSCKLRAFHLNKKYGLPANGDISLYQEQGGMCIVCGDPLGDDYSKMHVDHCHDTGVVRGILHQQCNITLKDNPDLLFKQQVYIARTSLDLRRLCVGV